MTHELGLMEKPTRWKKRLRLTMPYKIINEIANVPNKEILIPAHTKTRSKHGHKFHIVTKNINEYRYSFFP